MIKNQIELRHVLIKLTYSKDLSTRKEELPQIPGAPTQTGP